MSEHSHAYRHAADPHHRRQIHHADAMADGLHRAAVVRLRFLRSADARGDAALCAPRNAQRYRDQHAPKRGARIPNRTPLQDGRIDQALRSEGSRMSRYVLTLHSERDKLRAAEIISAAPIGSRVEVKAA